MNEKERFEERFEEKLEEKFEEIRPVAYRDGKVYFLDQTALPAETRWVEIASVEACRDAIRRLVVRGAPAIGIGAAFGMVVASRSETCGAATFEDFHARMRTAKERLASSRPTAVNLFWALERMEQCILASRNRPLGEIRDAVEREALAIRREEEEVCRRIGEHGQEIMSDGASVLTHCNAGALATGRYGTALAPVYMAKERGLSVRVFADETRPLLQGSRLTAYELHRAGIDVTVITDGMAAAVMAKGWVDLCIVGCDRLAANGDAANKIGTYGVAVLAKAHGIPFYVACPLSTLDLGTPSGREIEIEERDAAEIVRGMGKQTAPLDVAVYNPAFDVTPHELISGLITEKGLIRAPYAENLAKLRGART